MGRFNLILALIFCLIIAVFASANSQLVEINYIYGVVETSAVLVILGAAVLGALAVFIFGLFKNITTGFKLRALNQEIKNLQEKLQITEKERDTFLAQVGRLQGETTAALEQGGAGDFEKTGPEVTEKGGYFFSENKTEQGNEQRRAGEEKEC